MKTKFITLVFLLFMSICFVQSQTNSSNTIHYSENAIYQLFPTENFWTFIKLDTRNGKMWQVQFTLSEDGERTQVDLNPISLVFQGEEVKGRFTLYPTKNMYNFILLDQIYGHVYQVQWSIDEKNRGVIPISIIISTE